METRLSRIGGWKSFQIDHQLTEFAALFLGLFSFNFTILFNFCFVFLPFEQFRNFGILCVSVISSDLSNLLKTVNNYSPHACNMTCQFPKFRSFEFVLQLEREVNESKETNWNYLQSEN